MFPMIRILLLKVLRVKAGKASTERTGHLGVVDLMISIRVASGGIKHSERNAYHLQTGPHGTDCSTQSAQRSSNDEKLGYIQVGA